METTILNLWFWNYFTSHLRRLKCKVGLTASHAMGSDDRCELALESSRYRYSAAKFSKNIELQDFIEVNGRCLNFESL